MMPVTVRLLTVVYILASTVLPPWPVRTRLSMMSRTMNPILTPVPLGSVYLLGLSPRNGQCRLIRSMLAISRAKVLRSTVPPIIWGSASTRMRKLLTSEVRLRKRRMIRRPQIRSTF